MVSLSAAHRRPLSRLARTLGVLALLGAATALVVAARVPAQSATRLSTPVPAPASELPGADDPLLPADPYPADPDGWTDDDRPDTAGAYAGRAGGTVAPPEPTGQPVADGRPTAERAGPPVDPRRSLLWSGVLGLVISLTGLGMVGFRRRMW